MPSSDDVVMKEDITTNEILASVDAGKEQQDQLLIYVLYSALKNYPNVQTNENVFFC